MPRYVALLRGVNLGKRMRMEMRALREVLTGLGLDDATTYLQSGNAVFTSEATEAELAVGLERAIAARFGLQVPCLVRTAQEMRAVAAANPLAAPAGAARASLSRLHVVFLAAAPHPAALSALAELDLARYLPEEYRLGDREIYLWVPEPLTVSRLGNAFWERRLGVTATTRNWNTTLKLAELAGG